MKFHFHNDPNWRLSGAWYLYECKCGARKSTRAYSNMIGPKPYGWPSTIDRHGVFRNSSGWVKAPDEGWPRPEDEPVRLPPRGRLSVKKHTN